MLVGESSVLSTGFSTYSLELLKRLHQSGKYELMELASYSSPSDERPRELPWRHKSVMPKTEEEKGIYNSHPFNQFGEWKFEEACLEFRPDVVISFRDEWMDAFITRSPFRPYFKYAYMPTVDAEPQNDEWLGTFANADAVLTYSDWALELLVQQGKGNIKTICSAPPGADLESFSVVQNKRAHKQAMGLDPDILIIGSTMRNQRRKLHPDLIEAFARFLKDGPRELTQKTYLYLHTAWPDVGWNIPNLVKDAGVSSRTLFTYHCRSCGSAFPSFFQDTRCFCPACGKPTATFPNTQLGVSRKVLGSVYNTFDVYAQYSNSEGFGMPMAEAAACGVPIMATDYSAMSDVVRKLEGVPVKVLHLTREPETNCKRAVPDPADWVRQVTNFLLLPEPVRENRRRATRKAVERHYSWDLTAEIWMQTIDCFAYPDRSHTWESPRKHHSPAERVPEGLNNEEFVRWGMCHVAGRPELAFSYQGLRLLNDLNWGGTLVNGRMQDFDREKALHYMADIAAKRNHWEALRAEQNERGLAN